MPETITIAFTDIIDSTGAKIAVGDVAYREVSEKHDNLIREIAGQHELKQVGDSFMLRFDDPADATAKMIEVQRRLSAEPLEIDGKPLTIRVGIHIGNPLPTDGGKDFHGTAVDQAARYESLAVGGQILISAEMHALLESRKHELRDVQYHDWGQYFLRGVGWRRVFEVLWDGKHPISPSGKAQITARRYIVPFVGREKELGEIKALLEDQNQRLITLWGPGGIGKTRIADEIEHRWAQFFQDGAVFIDLESTANSEQAVEGEIRARCGISSGTLEQFFQNKNALLVINNFESVPNTRHVIVRLLGQCGGLKILVTSQVPLQIAGEQIYPVDSLVPHDAETMLLEYARRKDPHFTIEKDNRDQVESLFQLTDRMPFCLELAAAKVRPGRSLMSIVEGIGTSLSTLEALEIPSGRHRSVAACLDWSFGLLTGGEQSLFTKLSVFRGGFFAEDIARVCNEPKAAALLASLSDASLLRLAGDRFVLLPTAQEYVAQKLGESQVALRRRHAEHYLLVLEEADAMIRGAQQLNGFSRIRSDIENVRAGMVWSEEQRADEMIARYSWSLSSNLRPIGRVFEEVGVAIKGLAAAQRVPGVNAIAAAQNNLGNAYLGCPIGDRADNVRRAIACYKAALKDYSEIHHPFSWAMTKIHLGNAYGDLQTWDKKGNLKRALRYYEEALRVHTEDAYPKWWATIQFNLGLVFLHFPRGDRAANLAKAIKYFEASLRVRTEQFLPVDWAATQNSLGSAYAQLPSGTPGENLKNAIRYLEAALRVRSERDFPIDWAETQTNMAVAHLNLQRDKVGLLGAVRCCECALHVWTERDHPAQWARCIFTLAYANLRLDTIDGGKASDETVALFEDALRGFRSVRLHAEAKHVGSVLARLRKTLHSQ